MLNLLKKLKDMNLRKYLFLTQNVQYCLICYFTSKPTNCVNPFDICLGFRGKLYVFIFVIFSCAPLKNNSSKSTKYVNPFDICLGIRGIFIYIYIYIYIQLRPFTKFSGFPTWWCMVLKEYITEYITKMIKVLYIGAYIQAS